MIYRIAWIVPKKNTIKSDGSEDELSEATEKRIDQLPDHAQHIFKKAHSSAVKRVSRPRQKTRW